MSSKAPLFELRCQKCPRLVAYLEDIRQAYPDYHAFPVPAFGHTRARLLVVGLAPGLHGANATGRPFTGDHAGILLYRTLHKFGFANRPESLYAGDGLQLSDCCITNAVKCVPPQNKPTTAEIRNCNEYLRNELACLKAGSVLVALGAIAHRAIISARGLRQVDFPFAHGAEHALGEQLTLLDSYHCSRYNTQTKRLTPEMFEQVFERARQLVDSD